MIKLLIKLFIKNKEDVNNPKVREQYGVLGGVVGIICNIFLFALKLTIGILVNAFAIISDAFNNLTDSFSSVVSVISAKFSNSKPDKKHPFGYGRFEYISTLIVAFVIVVVGITLISSSIDKIIATSKGEVEPIATGKLFIISMIILGSSLLIKLWMFAYYRYIGKKINSSVMMASSIDSISDVLTSSSIIVVTVVGSLLLKDNYIYLDIVMSIIVAIIICINGLKIVFSTIGILLGKPASKEEIQQLEDIITADKIILGFHDLMVHDYGPGRKFASVHVEIDCNSNVIQAHEIIDRIEQDIYSKTGIDITIHMDPVDINSEEVKKANEIVANVLANYDNITFHDLRITDGEQNINLIFDLVLPYDLMNDKIKELIDEIKAKIKEENEKYTVVIKIDYSYID